MTVTIKYHQPAEPIQSVAYKNSDSDYDRVVRVGEGKIRVQGWNQLGCCVSSWQFQEAAEAYEFFTAAAKLAKQQMGAN